MNKICYSSSWSCFLWGSTSVAIIPISVLQLMLIIYYLCVLFLYSDFEITQPLMENQAGYISWNCSVKMMPLHLLIWNHVMDDKIDSCFRLYLPSIRWLSQAAHSTLWLIVFLWRKFVYLPFPCLLCFTNRCGVQYALSMWSSVDHPSSISCAQSSLCFQCSIGLIKSESRKSRGKFWGCNTCLQLFLMLGFGMVVRPAAQEATLWEYVD